MQVNSRSPATTFRYQRVDDSYDGDETDNAALAAALAADIADWSDATTVSRRRRQIPPTPHRECCRWSNLPLPRPRRKRQWRRRLVPDV